MLILDHYNSDGYPKQDAHIFYVDGERILKVYNCITIPNIGEKIMIAALTYNVQQIVHEPELLEIRYYLKPALD